MRLKTESLDDALHGVRHDAASLWQQAAQCRRLASSVLDQRTYEALIAMAMECEETAARLDRGENPAALDGAQSAGGQTSRD